MRFAVRSLTGSAETTAGSQSASAIRYVYQQPDRGRREQKSRSVIKDDRVSKLSDYPSRNQRSGQGNHLLKQAHEALGRALNLVGCHIQHRGRRYVARTVEEKAHGRDY